MLSLAKNLLSVVLISTCFVSAVPQLVKRQDDGAETVTVTITSTTTTDVTSTTTTYSSTTTAPTTVATTSTTSSTTPASSTTTSAAAAAASPASGGSAVLAAFQAPSVAFQDGVIPCSSFPSTQQGVVSLSYLGNGGWTGIQLGDAAVSSCQEGAYCSYACQPGMSKTQWPASQPSDGESRGGLLCQNGFLYRTNTATDYLCEWGVETAYFQSQLSSPVYVCRTDYPGSENMVIPTEVDSGALQPVSVVDSGSYFQWQGKPTSSQYYLNNMGVSQEDACCWSSAGSNEGNWSPLNIGAGSTSGVTYLSIFPNPLCGSSLNFNVKIVASPGSTINGDCTYINGVYSGGANGCTATVTSGSAYFVFY